MSPLIAVLAAIVLQSDQIAYLTGAVLSPDHDGSMAEEVDGIPRGRREHKVHGQNE